MKKSILYAAALAGVLGSCSQDDGTQSGASSSSVESEVPITIGVSNGSATITRGTGTVGGLESEDNEWNSQPFNLYMFNRGELELAKEWKNGAYGDYLFENYEMEAPSSGSTGAAVDPAGSIKYYPSSGEFDFVAYYADGANNGTAPALSGDAYTVAIEIDGTQDIMTADAVLDEDEEALLQQSLPTLDLTRLYSAHSARLGVNPNLVFNHLLTRFTFTIEGGNEESCSNIVDGTELGVQVTAISITSKTTGVMTVATVEDGRVKTGDIVWGDAKTSLSLMQSPEDGTADKSLVTLEPVVSTWDAAESKGVPTKVGEALLVAPDSEYEISIYTTQNVQEVRDGDYVARTDVMTDKLTLDGGFLAGTSYNVNIKVYALSEIDINATLTPWVEGDEIQLDPMDGPNN